MAESTSFLKIVPDGAPGARETTPSSSAAPDVVFIVDAEGTVLYVNRSLPEVHQDDVLGTSLYDYILPEHHMTVRTGNERVFATGEHGGYEVLGMSGRTSAAWYDCRVVPTMRAGRVVSATVIARDITVRKRVEEGLRRELDDTKRQLIGVQADLQRAEHLRGAADLAVQDRDRLSQFRAVLDEAGEAVFLVDPFDGRILDANGTACKWVSHRLEDLLTQKEADLRLRFPLRVPEAYGDHVTDTRDAQRAQTLRGEHRRADGSSFPVEVALTRHHLHGRDIVLAVARDSKARQQLELALDETEDRYRALFDLSRDGIYLSRRDGTIAEVNDAAVEIFGRPRESFIGFQARNLYVDTDDIRTFQKGVAKDGYVRDLEVTFIRDDGSRFHGLLTATLRRAGRDVRGYQCVIRPLPDRPADPTPPTRQSIEEAVRRGHGTVLLIEAVDPNRSEARHVLELAGVRVLMAESLAEALIIVRARAREIGVILADMSPDQIAEDAAFAEIRRAAPHTRTILLSSEGVDEKAAVEHLAHANLTAIVRKPVHPLALIQRTREALEIGKPVDPPRSPAPGPRTSRAVDLPEPI